jgi:hypothetical protein
MFAVYAFSRAVNPGWDEQKQGDDAVRPRERTQGIDSPMTRAKTTTAAPAPTNSQSEPPPEDCRTKPAELCMNAEEPTNRPSGKPPEDESPLLALSCAVVEARERESGNTGKRSDEESKGGAERWNGIEKG